MEFQNSIDPVFTLSGVATTPLVTSGSLFVWAFCEFDNEKYVYVGKRVSGLHAGLWAPLSSNSPLKTDSGAMLDCGRGVLSSLAEVFVENDELINISS